MPDLFQSVAKQKQLPSGLLYALALKESKTSTQSGRVVAWPWTLNYKKKGYYFRTREELYQSAKAILEAGDNNFDICVMQMNWRYHSKRFSNLYEALSPDNCIPAAADYLLEISNWKNRRNWSDIVGGYHNLNRSIGNSYAQGVKKICDDAGLSCFAQ